MIKSKITPTLTDSHNFRLKELACLHQISSYNLDGGEKGVRNFFRLINSDIVNAIQFPKICECKIQLKAYGGIKEIVEKTPRFDECYWYLQVPLCQRDKPNRAEGYASALREYVKDDIDREGLADITTMDAFLGYVTVGYRKVNIVASSSAQVNQAVNTKQPWLPEEYVLLKSICAQISLMIHSLGSDTLLSSMLPPNIAESLRQTGEAKAQQHMCTILFTDIVGFTSLSGSSTPEGVFDMLNDLYTRFDELVEAAGAEKLYKVETIGDAYMVVSGLPCPMPGDSHALEIANLAAGLMREVHAVTITTKDGKKHPIKIRCGIHTGPVVAGVVGKVNPRYCLFGDTVNTASRMESNSESMRIHISESTQRCLMRLKEGGSDSADLSKFQILSRGGIQIKGKGEMQTFWLEPK